MTVLRNGTTTIHLYRHCDGYPACAGVDLATALTKHAKGGIADVAATLLAQRYETGITSSPSRPVYELADWTPEQQGDLEHVYTVEDRHGRADFDGSERIRFRVTHRERKGWGEPERWDSKRYDTEDFAAFTAREEAAMQERIRRYHAGRDAQKAAL